MQEKSSIKRNILSFIDYKGISKYKFYQDTGITRGVLDMESGMSEENTAKFIAQYPEVSLEWLMTGQGSMFKSEHNKIEPQPNIKKEAEETRPRIPMDALAGSLTIAQNGVTLYECEQLPVIKAFARYDFTIFARGDSMYPEYHSGDELACVFIRDSKFIQWGRVHVLDTSQGIILKRIFKGDNCIICKSDNPNYPEFNIEDSELYNIALVIGMIRRY